MKTYLFILILAFALTACNSKADEKEENLKPVKYEMISYSHLNRNPTFSGVVKADIETRLSFKVSGTLNSLRIKEGDRVQNGQHIASIDPRDYKLQHEQALAQQQSAEAQLLTARSVAERMERLYENNSVPLSEYEKAKVNYSNARAQLVVATQQLQAAHNQLEYTNIYAPVDGFITSLMVEENELVSAGRAIATIASNQNPEIEVAVPGSIIHQLSLGQEAIITLSSLPNQTYSGKIVKLAFASGQSSTFPIRVSISGQNNALRPGMAAEVVFMAIPDDTNPSNTLIAPVASVAADSQGNFVYVIHHESDKGYWVEKRGIVVGELKPQGFKIREGLNENDRVVSAGIGFLRDGMMVKLLERE